jgi:3-isopropylmalate dehydrogenase
MTLYLIECPERFDVIVTDNMFGDIITDLAAVIQGGLGVAAGGNVNPEGVSMFEPIGGTAPDFTGKNEINPIAAIGAAGMMLESLGEDKAASAVEKAVTETTPRMKSMRAAEMGMGTSEVGDLVVSALKKEQ